MSNTQLVGIKLVRPDDVEYVAWRRRMADARPSRGGPRHAGEYLGGLVEQCVQHYLRKYVPLQEERILTWEQRMRTGRAGRLYRELDGVWQIDEESLCLFEIKFTFPENIERGTGIKQLNIAQEMLFATNRYQYILRRLVYVSDEQFTVLDELPAVEPGDEYTDIGVIWVPMDLVAAAAEELGLVLPENWREPESREGYMEQPEREEWRQYATTAEKEVDPEATEIPADNPLAQALRRAMGEQS